MCFFSCSDEESGVLSSLDPLDQYFTFRELKLSILIRAGVRDVNIYNIQTDYIVCINRPFTGQDCVGSIKTAPSQPRKDVSSHAAKGKDI